MEALEGSAVTREPTYRIVRHFQRNGQQTVKRGLSAEEAREWCKDPETSSRTCEGDIPRRRTNIHGPWFDGYEEEEE